LPRRPQDEFSEKTKRTLRERVALLCSNPDCRILTVGPASSPEKSVSVGEAAHICAAAPGGPRYNQNMTSSERSSINNAVWLCSVCSDMIDKDPNKYPVELLRQWKSETEKFASESRGTKLPDKDDAVNTLAAALTGNAGVLLSDGMHNLSVAASNYLKKIDPRLQVDFAYDSQKTCISFEPSGHEPVDFSLEVTPTDPKDFTLKMDQLFKCGEPIEANLENFEMKGSRVFEVLRQTMPEMNNGTWQVIPNGIKAVLKIQLIGDENDIFILDDIHGKLYSGTEAFSCKGETMEGLFSVTMRSFFVNLKEGSFTFNINFTKWIGLNIRSLPYFQKVYEFIEKIQNNWKVNMLLESNGSQLLRSQEWMPSDSYHSLFLFLRYLYLCRELAGYLNIDIVYKETEFNVRDLQKLENFYRALNRIETSMDKTGKISFTMVIETKEQLNKFVELVEDKKLVSFRWQQNKSDTLTLFEQKIAMPLYSFSMFPVYYSARTDCAIAVGSEVLVELLPGPNCKLLYQLVEEEK